MIKIDPERSMQSTLLFILDEIINENIAFISSRRLVCDTEQKQIQEMVLSDSYTMRLINSTFFKNLGAIYIKSLLEATNENKNVKFEEIPYSGYEYIFSQTFRISYELKNDNG